MAADDLPRTRPASSGTIVVPFVFFPDGEPEPVEITRHFLQPIRLRATFVPDGHGRNGGRFEWPAREVGSELSDVADRHSRSDDHLDSSAEGLVPVTLTDDRGEVVMSPVKRTPIQRPKGWDPHYFVYQGLKDGEYVRQEMMTSVPPLDSNGHTRADYARMLRTFVYETEQIKKFRQFGEWDAQRAVKENHSEFVDYATIAIGLYGAASGIPESVMLAAENTYAASHSRFGSDRKMSKDYVYLPEVNVENTLSGYDLYRSGRISTKNAP